MVFAPKRDQGKKGGERWGETGEELPLTSRASSNDKTLDMLRRFGNLHKYPSQY